MIRIEVKMANLAIGDVFQYYGRTRRLGNNTRYGVVISERHAFTLRGQVSEDEMRVVKVPPNARLIDPQTGVHYDLAMLLMAVQMAVRSRSRK